MDKSKLYKALIAFVGLVIVLFVVFALVKCTGGPENASVSFDTDGGTAISAITVKMDDQVTRPDDPVKEGYTFSHWELDGIEFDFSEPITSDLTLKAIWEPMTFTVMFDVNGGSHVEDQNVAFGESPDKPDDPTRDGYDFTGWYIDDELFDFSQGIDEDLTLVAGWKKTEEVIGEPTPTPEPTAEPTPTPEPTVTPTTQESAITPTPTAKPTAAPTPTAKPTAAPTPTPIPDPVYTIGTSQPAEFLGSPQVVVTVYKDNVAVSAVAVYSDNTLIGNTNNDKGLLLADRNYISYINRAELSDGTIVEIEG